MKLRTSHRAVSGVDLFLAEAGEGPPLLLIHGFLVSHKEWLPVLPHLARHFRCIAPDLPGFGQSAKPTGPDAPYGWVRSAALLRDLLDALDVPRAHIVGHSMGGGIALTFAADHPDRTLRAAAIDAACYPFDVPWKGRLPLLPGLGPLLFKRLYGRALFHDYFRNDVWSGHGGIDLERVDEYFRDFAPPAARDAAYEALLHSVDPSPVAERIPRIEAETLALWGSEDRIFPLSLGERLARDLPRGRLEVFEGVAHAPNEEAPERTAEVLRAHLLAARAPAAQP